MMKRKTANSTKWIKILMVLPVLGALVYFFSEKVTAQAEGNSEKISINMESKDNGSSKTRFSTANQSLESKVPTATNYQKLATEFQLKISNAGMFTSPSDKEIAVLQTQFQELEKIYFNLSMEERRKVARVSFPYAKIEKDGQIRYKKFEFLTAEERKTLNC